MHLQQITARIVFFKAETVKCINTAVNGSIFYKGEKKNPPTTLVKQGMQKI